MVATIFVRRIRRKVPFAAPRRGARTILSMLGPSRPVPRVGARARIAHFGGSFEPGTVIAVHDDGRRVEVRGEEGGETLEFVLSDGTCVAVPDGGLGDVHLQLPDTEHMVVDDARIPVGNRSVAGTKYDLRHGRRLGELRLDDGFTGLTAPSGRAVTEVRTRGGGARLWFGEAFPNLPVTFEPEF